MPLFVIPAEAGIQNLLTRLDSRPTLSRGQAFGGNDRLGQSAPFGLALPFVTVGPF